MIHNSSIGIILNARSGAHRAGEMRERLERVFRESGRPFRIALGRGDELSGLVEEAAKDCEVLVAGGGDGTICCVAEAALKFDRVLGVIPLGTFNYFARNLRIPLEPEEAAQVVLGGQTVRAPVLDLDGRLVLNNSSLGIHPAVLLRRRKLYRRWGRNQLNAYLSVILTAFRETPKVRVRLATDEGEVLRETPLVMICSNAYQMEAFGLAGEECLAAGKFALYVARMAGKGAIFHLGLRTLFRRLRAGVDYEIICCSDVTIESLRRKELRAAVDGELEKLQSPMRFRMQSKSLCVLAPGDEPST